jgi:hypothetical protein
LNLEKFVKRVAGRTDLEDGMKKLDKLTLEEVAMASAQLLKVTHDIHNEVTNVANGVDCVDEKVQDIVVKVGDVKCDVQVVGDQVEVVDERVRAIADGKKDAIFCQIPAYKLVIFRRQGANGNSNGNKVNPSTSSRELRRREAFVNSPVDLVEYLTWSQGTKCERTSENGNLLRIHQQATTSRAIVNTRERPIGSLQMTNSGNGRLLVPSCGSMGDVGLFHL